MNYRELKERVENILPGEQKTYEAFLEKVKENRNKIKVGFTNKDGLIYDFNKNKLYINRQYRCDTKLINYAILTNVAERHLKHNEAFNTKKQLLSYMILQTYDVWGVGDFDQIYNTYFKDTVITEDMINEVEKVYYNLIA
jgi:hypothetical protein